MARSVAPLAVGLLVALALGLRSTGLGWMLPQRVEPDSQIVLQTRVLRGELEAPAEQFGTYGLVTACVAAVLPQVRPSVAPAGAPLEEHLAAAGADVLRVRIAVLLLSLVVVPATWHLARQALGRAASLFAAALVATSLLLLSLSQQARPHAGACGLFLVAVLAALELRRRPGWRSYAIAGVAAGLAVGVLQSGLIVLPSLALAHLLRERSASAGSRFGVLLALALLVPMFLAFNPTLLETALEGRRVALGAHRISVELFDGGGFSKLAWALWAYEPTLCGLAALGLPIAAARWPIESAPRRDLVVVGSHALLYLAAFGAYSGFEQRMSPPLLPYLALVAAMPLDAGLRRARPAARRWIGAAALGVLAVPALVAARYASLRTADDTLERAAQWVGEHLRPGEDLAVVSFPLDLPLFQERESLEANRALVPDDPGFYPRFTRWFRYQAYVAREDLGGPLAARFRLRFSTRGELTVPSRRLGRRLEALGARYVIVELRPAEGSDPGNRRIEEALAPLGRRVARFSPWRESESRGSSFDYEAFISPLESVVAQAFAAERLGPVIEVYELAAR
jgi:hypothetical protein